MNKEYSISPLAFLHKLQLEYFSHKLRSVIYNNPLHVKVNKDIAEKKKEKIKQVALTNNVLSIFDSERFYEIFRETYFENPFGMPNFQYRKDSGDGMSFYDKIAFFNGWVTYKDEECKVLYNDVETDSLLILYKGEEKDVNYVDVEKFIYI